MNQISFDFSDWTMSEAEARERFAALEQRFCRCGRELAFVVRGVGEHDRASGGEYANFEAVCSIETGLSGALRSAADLAHLAVRETPLRLDDHDVRAIGQGIAS